MNIEKRYCQISLLKLSWKNSDAFKRYGKMKYISFCIESHATIIRWAKLLLTSLLNKCKIQETL